MSIVLLTVNIRTGMSVSVTMSMAHLRCITIRTISVRWFSLSVPLVEAVVTVSISTGWVSIDCASTVGGSSISVVGNTGVSVRWFSLSVTLVEAVVTVSMGGSIVLLTVSIRTGMSMSVTISMAHMGSVTI